MKQVRALLHMGAFVCLFLFPLHVHAMRVYSYDFLLNMLGCLSMQPRQERLSENRFNTMQGAEYQGALDRDYQLYKEAWEKYPTQFNTHRMVLSEWKINRWKQLSAGSHYTDSRRTLAQEIQGKIYKQDVSYIHGLKEKTMISSNVEAVCSKNDLDNLVRMSRLVRSDLIDEENAHEA